MNTKELSLKQIETGEIPDEWGFRELGSLGKVVTGKTPPTKDADNFGEGYPFITPRDMIGQKYIRGTERYLTEKGKDTVKNCLLPSDAVCVSCIGSDMGKVIMTDRPSITNQQLNSLVCEHAEPQFAYYGIVNIAKNLRDVAFHSTAVPILNKSAFSRFQIFMPKEIAEQHAIAKILGDLDEKIELNHRMNKTLEAIAQALFKRWFVDFNFPDEKSRPYKDSGGRMIDSELGAIPAGWDIQSIEEVVTVKGGTTPSTNNPEFWGGDIFWCTPRDLSRLSSPVLLDTERKITETGLRSIGSGLFKKGVLLLSSRAPIGYLAISEIPVSINQGFIAILCDKKVSNYFMYYWAHVNISRIKNMANGSTFQEINKANFRRIKITVPPESSLRQFDRVSSGLWNALVNNEMQNRILSQIRDSLLPKLMSGKIRVNQ